MNDLTRQVRAEEEEEREGGGWGGEGVYPALGWSLVPCT